MIKDRSKNQDIRITIILPSLDRRISPIKGALLLANFLHQEGFTISLLSLKSNQDKDLKENFPFREETLNIKSFFEFFIARKRIIRHLSSMKIDLVITFTIFPDLLVSTIKSIKKISFIRAYLIDQYKQDFPIFSHFVTTLHFKALKRFHYLIAMTPSMRSEIISLGVQPENVIINKNSIDVIAIRDSISDYPISEDQSINIAIAGSLTKRKQVSDAIKAISRIDHPIVLNIFGSGPEYNNLVHLAERMNISDKIIFHGYVDNLAMNFINMDIILSTSMSEGVSRALIEAMSLGKTVIASDIPGSLDLIQHSKTGFIYRKGDCNHLAKTINEVLSQNKFIDSKYLMEYMERHHDYRSCYKELVQKIL